MEYLSFSFRSGVTSCSPRENWAPSFLLSPPASARHRLDPSSNGCPASLGTSHSIPDPPQGVRLHRRSRLTQQQAGLSVVLSPWLGSWVRWLKEGTKERGARRNGRGEMIPGFHSNRKDAGLRRVGGECPRGRINGGISRQKGPPMSSSPGVLNCERVPPGRHLGMAGGIFGCQVGWVEALLASSGQRPGMLQNILPCTGASHSSCPAQNIIVLRLRTLVYFTLLWA